MSANAKRASPKDAIDPSKALVPSVQRVNETRVRHGFWPKVRRTAARIPFADHLLSASLVCWLVWLRPDFVRAELPLIAGWAALAATALLVGWVKHGRVGDLHLYSAKLAGTLAYAFAIWVLLFGTYSPIVFRAIVAVCALAALETLVLFSTRRSVDERIGSVLSRRGPGGTRSRGEGASR